MEIVETISDLRQARHSLKGRVGVVPTMGALHEGHLSLVNAAREDNDAVLVTIFVNPTQFAPDEDLDAYPRDLSADIAKLDAAGVDLIFTPTSNLMYPPGYQTYVEVEQVTRGLEGAHRPGHFRGVTTVVSKLFNLTQPKRAYFGQKDAQQVVVIRRMVADLNFPVEIVVCPITRESDGLAMSSRNVYLNTEQRQAATVLNQALKTASTAYANGENHPENLRRIMREVLAGEPLAQVDYVSVADAVTLGEQHDPVKTPLLLSLTAQVGKPRLLDNTLVPSHLNTREGLTATLGKMP